jgi:hypothetical protein
MRMCCTQQVVGKASLVIKQNPSVMRVKLASGKNFTDETYEVLLLNVLSATNWQKVKEKYVLFNAVHSTQKKKWHV